jgi:predicted metal-binding protein
VSKIRSTSACSRLGSAAALKLESEKCRNERDALGQSQSGFQRWRDGPYASQIGVFRCGDCPGQNCSKPLHAFDRDVRTEQQRTCP